jgi:hypothetical protein
LQPRLTVVLPPKAGLQVNTEVFDFGKLARSDQPVPQVLELSGSGFNREGLSGNLKLVSDSAWLELERTNFSPQQLTIKISAYPDKVLSYHSQYHLPTLLQLYQQMFKPLPSSLVWLLLILIIGVSLTLAIVTKLIVTFWLILALLLGLQVWLWLLQLGIHTFVPQNSHAEATFEIRSNGGFRNIKAFIEVLPTATQIRRGWFLAGSLAATPLVFLVLFLILKKGS